MARYEKDPDEDEEADGDCLNAEMKSLLEEFAMTDQVNSNDLFAWKKDVDKKVVHRLNKQREHKRREMMTAKAAKQKRAFAKRLARAARLRQARVKPRRRGAAAPVAADSSGAPPQPSAVAPEAEPACSGALGEGGVAVVEAAAPPPPPPVAVGRAPRGGGGWVVLEVASGWLRFNSSLGRLDAHCRSHPGCKMDRSLKKGPIGLCMAWLSHRSGDKAEHDTAKVTLSAACSFAERQEGRQAFRALAADRGSVFQEALDRESEMRSGQAEEPDSLTIVAEGGHGELSCGDWRTHSRCERLAVGENERSATTLV